MTLQETTFAKGASYPEPISPYVTDEADILHDIRDHAARIDSIEEKLDRVLTIAANCETLITKIVAEVKPTIDELMQSSLFKMLNIGKKK